MPVTWLWMVTVVSVLAGHARSQTAPAANVPSSPLWTIFSQLLSTQTGRTVRDINILGLSDPTINQLWTSYSATLSQLTQTPAPTPPARTTTTTTPPPLPDLYQNSYSFSSNSNNNQGSSGSAPASIKKPVQPSAQAVTNDLLALIQQISSGLSSPLAPQRTSTSAQDVMSAYAQLSGGGNAASGGLDYQSMVQKYLTSMGGSTNSVASAPSASSGKSPYQVLLDQLSSSSPSSSGSSSSAGSSGAPSSSAGYEQLLQQYNQILAGGKSGSQANPTPAAGSSAGSSTDQLAQVSSQLAANKPSGPSSNSTPGTNTSTGPQDSFEKQLATFFPQFRSLFPSSPNNSAASNTPGSDPTQMIFDALLFPSAQQPANTTASTTPAPAAQQAASNPNSALGFVQNMMSSGAKPEAMLSNHVQNVFKTRASREMGCRFLPELLELDMLPTTPINCLNRCPFPYVNSQQFGFYCVCCPPGVNEHTVGMMSMVRGPSYLETPLSVIS